jgi:hypothetical protein
MKILGALSTAVLSLTLGATALAYPQQDQHDQQDDKDKSAHQDEKKDDKKAQPEKPAKQEEKAAPKREENVKPEEKGAKQQDERIQQTKPEQQQHASGGDRGGRIPDDHYKANFGREHTFRVSQGDYGNRRFQYGGYWFGFAGAWPSNWLYTQDVYVVDIDGVYYLCNPNYPGVNVELIVTL